MYRNKIGFISLLGVMFLSFNSCVTLSNQNFNLYGMVYSKSAEPVVDAEIVLNEKQKTVSDYNGRFILNSVTPGLNKVSVKKEGFEIYESEVTIRSKTDVLYISILSKDDLQDMVKIAMKEKKWTEAAEFLDRLLSVDPENPVSLYYKALYYCLQDNPQRDSTVSYDTLMGILEKGYKEAGIYLLLSDISLYDKNDKSAALGFLQKAAAVESSPLIQEKIEKLEN